ncbi:MAG: HIT family protein [Victivallales bacterium]|nr:HIT family protein [Victivallales bacterium]
MKKTDENCIFCRIVQKQEQAEILYEDDNVMAFMDKAPINPGHILVIPKNHYVSCVSVPENIAGRMFHVASRLAAACKRAFKSDGYNLHLSEGGCAGQDISHVHTHLITRFLDDNFFWNWRKLDISEKEIKSLAGQIIDKLKIE